MGDEVETRERGTCLRQNIYGGRRKVPPEMMHNI